MHVIKIRREKQPIAVGTFDGFDYRVICSCGHNDKTYSKRAALNHALHHNNTKHDGKYLIHGQEETA